MSNPDYPPNAGQKETDADEPVDLTKADRAEGGDDKPPAQEQPDDQPAPDAPASEVQTLNDRILRLAAELENTRRRAEREKSDAGRYAIANFARDLLGVADNFERALAAVGDDPQTATAETFSGLVAGIRMTEKELLTVLERHGVQRIHPAGEKFDPNLHQAVAQVPSDAIATGHVVDVAQPGFTIGHRVLRAAMVTVSSGPGAKGDSDAGQGAHLDTEA